MIKSVNNQDFKIIAVSNRKLCNRPFLEQIERVCKIHPEAVILREKDLTEEEYGTLAKRSNEYLQPLSGVLYSS